MVDRVVGTVVLLLTLGYAWEASRMQVGFLSDPLGPRPFPYLIAALLGLSAFWLLFRPDPNPTWPPRSAWRSFALVLLSLVAYAYLVVPLGFILTTTLEMALLSYLFGARFWPGLGGALAFTLVVYFLFTEGLGVSLPVGRVFG
ncbi:tripartite tricarboxylate transporter TctB family protein [Meiothermus rufus]|uniref:tripartite tricarboxylate transporter TctB family protein n=1 Tax=Meiothermus rufus TaxID=604332 RepID=UPI000420A0D7|nr:tripartite tricarboxylate transporter TctB family protein [Meiothermus rufus]